MPSDQGGSGTFKVGTLPQTKPNFFATLPASFNFWSQPNGISHAPQFNIPWLQGMGIPALPPIPQVNPGPAQPPPVVQPNHQVGPPAQGGYNYDDPFGLGLGGILPPTSGGGLIGNGEPIGGGGRVFKNGQGGGEYF